MVDRQTSLCVTVSEKLDDAATADVACDVTRVSAMPRVDEAVLGQRQEKTIVDALEARITDGVESKSTQRVEAGECVEECARRERLEIDVVEVQVTFAIHHQLQCGLQWDSNTICDCGKVPSRHG